MARGIKTGGRKKGTPNKLTVETRATFAACEAELRRLRCLDDDDACDPIETLVLLMLTANNEWVKFRAAKELARYLYPKMRATDYHPESVDPEQQNDAVEKLLAALDETRAKLLGQKPIS